MDFKVGEYNYRSGRLTAFQQFHVARKLGPILAKLGPSSGREGLSMIDLLEPAVDALAEMPEADCDYVLRRCLSVVQRQVGTAWQSVWNDSAKRLMFEDIDLAAMIQISMQVLGDNLGNFISAPASNTTLPQSG